MPQTFPCLRKTSTVHYRIEQVCVCVCVQVQALQAAQHANVYFRNQAIEGKSKSECESCALPNENKYKTPALICETHS